MEKILRIPGALHGGFEAISRILQSSSAVNENPPDMSAMIGLVPLYRGEAKCINLHKWESFSAYAFCYRARNFDEWFRFV
jgi:hypothetical protein